VNKIISATTLRFATIFKLMAEIGVEGEELHQTHRNQFETTQAIISIKGLKGHGSANYHLKQPIAEMLREYLAKDPRDYPFPEPKTMSIMWRRAREIASKNDNDPSLKTIPMKNLRNYSGAQFWYSFPDPIGLMRHLRHKRMETTMHYLRAITSDGDIEYDCKVVDSTDTEGISILIEKGHTKQDEAHGKHFYRKRK
jgi:integrase